VSRSSAGTVSCQVFSQLAGARALVQFERWECCGSPAGLWVEGAFGWNRVDYAMLVKLYSEAIEGRRRCSPPQVVGTERHRVMGQPRPEARFHELRGAPEPHHANERREADPPHERPQSKKLENHGHAMALHYTYYNFCRSHETLTKQRKGINTTPAMAAGVAGHVWKVSEIVDLLRTTECSSGGSMATSN
jgi:hypothetical protein